MIKAGDRALLNLGCGSRFHPQWTNIDLNPVAVQVQAHDLRQPLPFPDCHFDVVYHSHVLEHFQRDQGLQFLRHCHRVLKPDGIMRVAVPDLEEIVRLYLVYLEQAANGVDAAAQEKYQWMMLELYDQAVRSQSGGAMAQFMRRMPPEVEPFVISRLGQALCQEVKGPPPSQASILPRLRRLNLQSLWQKAGSLIMTGLFRVFWGKPGVAMMNEAIFRATGENHCWMYDRYSLPVILQEAGFADVQQMTAFTSRIEGWPSFSLDTDPDGRVYKPESLYCEAVKLR